MNAILPLCTSSVESRARASSESVRVASEALSSGESDRPGAPEPLPEPEPEPYACSRPRPAPTHHGPCRFDLSDGIGLHGRRVQPHHNKRRRKRGHHFEKKTE
ncbi:hypothetical protein EVAR_4760_1 [Eumeta japonica]|uniref:Uncharacterized protein n=1 Tax=Eumeta variegata TaxID=151549 RepID=A0A4C1SYQ0_EUMVA|nr:hypothetical protein EVAR_4760_1 [Eumeta japonica]